MAARARICPSIAICGKLETGRALNYLESGDAESRQKGL
jgi:hypothetical protein